MKLTLTETCVKKKKKKKNLGFGVVPSQRLCTDGLPFCCPVQSLKVDLCGMAIYFVTCVSPAAGRVTIVAG